MIKEYRKKISGFLTPSMIAIIVIIIIGTMINAEEFLTFENGMNISRQVVTNGLLAIGMAFVVISGSIDLSVPATMIMGSYITLYFSRYSLPMAMLLTILVGAFIGAFNGYLVTRIKFPAMIATFSTQMLVKGILLLLTKGNSYSVKELPGFLKVLGYGDAFGFFPVSVLFLIAIFLIFNYLSKRVPAVRNVYAVGGNAEAAKMMGVSVFKTMMTSHILCGVLAAMAGIHLAARTGAAVSAGGEGYDMLAIASIVIGGISMSGGKGKISGALMGGIFISLLANVFKMQTVFSTHWEKAITGILLLLVLLAQAIAMQRNHVASKQKTS